MRRIVPVIKNYAWGSTTALASLSGREPSTHPEAELWVGAHEAGPSTLADDERTLDALIADDPAHALGSAADLLDGRLPFLLKILAADKALSIQAHPGPERARTAPEGTYADRFPKPEAWVPLTPSVAFVGSLPFDEAAARLTSLQIPQLDELVEAARGRSDPAHALLAAILAIPSEQHESLVRQAFAAVAREAGTLPSGAQREAWMDAVSVEAQFPGDIGALVTLTMNHVVMEPGTSYFIGAGVMHSFVRGVTLEILANSDNVVRAGLTSKRINIAELLEIVDVSSTVEPSTPRAITDGILRYESSSPYFSLYEATAGSDVELPGEGAPCLVMSLGGVSTVEVDGEVEKLDSLECAWWPAGAGAATAQVADGARLFIATVND